MINKIRSSKMRSTVQLRSAKIPGLVGLVADHYWFVVSKNKKKDRWEIWQKRNVGGQSWNYLHKNLMNYDSGVGAGESRLEHQWFGDEADRIINKLEQSPTEYINRDCYRYWPGPNSNTYIQWILNELNLDLMLGPSAIGKDYLGVIGIKKFDNLFQASTPLLGIKLKWPTRFEVHILTLTFGINIKPFQFILPFLRTKLIKKDMENLLH